MWRTLFESALRWAVYPKTIGLCREPSSRPQDGSLRSRTGGFCRYPSTGRRRQTGRPNARPRTGCITRRTYFLRIIFKVLRLVYYCASVGADFYSFSYRTSCDLVARDQNLSPLAQPGFWRWLPAGGNRLCLHSCSIVCLVIVPLPINRWPSVNGSSSRRQVFD